MEILEKKILGIINGLALVNSWTNIELKDKLMPIINQAMRENAVEFDKFIYNKWRLNEGPSPDTWIYYDVLNNIKTPEQLHDLFMDSKTKSK